MQNRKRILLVDDDESVLFVLQHALSRSGQQHELILCGNGRDALKLAEQPLDLVITDIRLPGLDGVALTEALRARGQHMPVIWITAYGENAFIERVAELGVYRCLNKPVEVGEIRRISQEALRADPGS